MKLPLYVYWSRRDFRINDNPALEAITNASIKNNIPLLPIFILEDYMVESKPDSQFGYPSRWFLSKAIPEFAKNFKEFVLVRGKAVKYFIELSKKYELTIFVNDDVYIDFYTQVKKIKDSKINIQILEDTLTISKELRSGNGTIYSIFTPFKKMVWADFTIKRKLSSVDLSKSVYLGKMEIKNIPNQIKIDSKEIWQQFNKERKLKINNKIINLDDLIPLPKLDGWYINESQALARFEYFLESDELTNYDKNRDSLEIDAMTNEGDGHAYSSKTSKMSLALAWGLVSSRMLVKMMQDYYQESFDNPFSNRVSEGALTYISELIWREFYRYQLFHRPELMNLEFQKRFVGTIKWVDNKIALERFIAWVKGETGYPIVDAAMKQIAETGWMHNRSRMIVASILTKNLGVDWRWGQEYFRAVLIDLDEASNNGGWQWGASVGTDPKPIRIFNPELQAKNYDNSGAYQKRWLNPSDSFILESPRLPIIEHKQARDEALIRYGLRDIEPRDY